MNAIGDSAIAPRPCNICPETDSSRFGGRSLVKTSCSQRHQSHLDCIYRSLSGQENISPDRRRCNVCSEPAMPLLRNRQNLAVDACQTGDCEALEKMLLLNPNIHRETYNGSNLLTIAAQNNRTECIEALIKAGAVVNVELLKCLDPSAAIGILYVKANQLLTDNLDLLEEIKKNDFARPGNAQSSKSYSHDINSIIEILNEEQTKLKEKEMVVVVVGTTSSGKSTAINALIGQKLLPKSNRAMTAIPMQIKHNPGLAEPELYFENPKPLEDLYENLLTNIRSSRGKSILERLGNVSGIENFRKMLNRGNRNEVVKRCTGADEIYEHLNKLNDLVRLSVNFGIEKPLAGFVKRSHFPKVEVEFSSLHNLPEVNGNFILLDTPGSNEGNNQIRDVVRKQMDTASAVFPVMNFDQEGTSVRKKMIGDIKEYVRSDDNIYTLLNKIDVMQNEEKKDEASDDEDPLEKKRSALWQVN